MKIYCKLIALNMLVTYIHNWHTYGHGLFSLSYVTLLVIITIYMCTSLILYIDGGTLNSYHYTLENDIDCFYIECLMMGNMSQVQQKIH